MGKGADDFGQGKSCPPGAGPDVLEYRTMEKWRNESITPPRPTQIGQFPHDSSIPNRDDVFLPAGNGDPVRLLDVLRGFTVLGVIFAVIYSLSIQAPTASTIAYGALGGVAGAAASIPVYGAILLLRLLGWILGWVVKIAAWGALIACAAYVIHALG